MNASKVEREEIRNKIGKGETVNDGELLHALKEKEKKTKKVWNCFMQPLRFVVKPLDTIQIRNRFMISDPLIDSNF